MDYIKNYDKVVLNLLQRYIDKGYIMQNILIKEPDTQYYGRRWIKKGASEIEFNMPNDEAECYKWLEYNVGGIELIYSNSRGGCFSKAIQKLFTEIELEVIDPCNEKVIENVSRLKDVYDGCRRLVDDCYEYSSTSQCTSFMEIKAYWLLRYGINIDNALIDNTVAAADIMAIEKVLEGFETVLKLFPKVKESIKFIKLDYTDGYSSDRLMYGMNKTLYLNCDWFSNPILMQNNLSENRRSLYEIGMCPLMWYIRDIIYRNHIQGYNDVKNSFDNVIAAVMGRNDEILAQIKELYSRGG